MKERAEKLVACNVGVALGGARILDGASLDVNPGEVVGLIGPNGAGKSTFLRALLGLVPVEAGEIHIGDNTLTEAPAEARARLMAYAPQGAPVHWPLTVERVVALGRIPHLGPWQKMSDDDRQWVETALELTETLRLRHRIVTSLSGGERAAVMMARTLAVGAPWLLADEPVAALDPYHQLEVMEILRGETKRNTGVVVVLHDLTLAMRFCDRVFLMADGRLVASGAPAEVLTAERLKQVYRVEALQGGHDGAGYVVPWTRLGR